MAEMITPHFSRAELACPCCGQMKMAAGTLDKLEAARLIYGQPVELTSAYRCEDHNRAVGGKVSSPHLAGRAVDVSRTYGPDLLRLIDAFRSAGFHGVGMGDNRLHFDDHPTLGPRAWMYP